MKFDWKKLHVTDDDVEFGRQVDALHKLLEAEYAERVQAPMRAKRKADDAVARELMLVKSPRMYEGNNTDPAATRRLLEKNLAMAPVAAANIASMAIPGRAGLAAGMGLAATLEGDPTIGATAGAVAGGRKTMLGALVGALGTGSADAQAGLLSKPSLVEYLLSRPSAIFTNRLPRIRDTGLIYNTHHPQAVSEMSQPDVRRRFEREVLSIHPNKVWTERPVSSAVVDRSVWGDTGYPVYPFAGYGKQALVTQPLGKMPQARVSIGDSLNNWEEGFGDVLRPAKVSDLTEKYLRDGLAAKDLTPTLSRLQELVHGAGPGEYLEVLHPTPAAAMNATRAFVDPTGQVQKLRDLINLRMNKSDRNDELIRALGLKAGGRVKFDRGGIVKKFLSRMPEYFEGAANKPTPVGALSVVKNKGGNWLRGSVEGALSNLGPAKSYFKRRIPTVEELRRTTPEELRSHILVTGLGPDPQPTFDRVARDGAISGWIEGPLTKYVKNRMATPDDEVRKLAEQGVLHFDPAQYAVMRSTARSVANREKGNASQGGTQSTRLGQSPLAQAWETLSDSEVTPGTYTSLMPGALKKDHPENLRDMGGDFAVANPHAAAYQFGNWSDSGAPRVLGFDHLIDELSNALNPGSGLPRHLLLTPEAVQNMSMEKAVRRVADINAWRAAQKVEANRKLAEQAALVREYAENNPKGLRWVELKAGDLPEGWKAAEKAGNTNYPYQDPEGIWHTAQEAPHVKALADQLKYEGDTMGHCVGGYCDDVLSGRSRIFSLRDAKGEPHVTVEVEPPTLSRNFDPDGDTLSELINGLPEDQFAEFKRDILDKVPRAMDLDDASVLQAELTLKHPTFGPVYRARLEGPPSIVQIKGKQNKKPNDEYLPFVQDFVRNSPVGKSWADVGDLQNTGLTRHPTGKYITDAEAEALAKRHFGNVRMGNKPDDVENPWQYANRIKRYDPDMLSDTDKAFLADWEAGNFASGGVVAAPKAPVKQDEVYEGSLRKPEPKQPVRDMLRAVPVPVNQQKKTPTAALGVRASAEDMVTKSALDRLYAAL